MVLARWKDLCIDATDAGRMGDFWGRLLGLEVDRLDDGDVRLRGSEPERTIWVNTVPEPKTVKQRVHLDVETASLDAVLDLGATMVLPASESGFHWSVVTDPEGGELCVFVRDDFPSDPPARLMEVVVDCADSDASHALADWWATVLGGRAADDGRGFWWVQDVDGLPFDALPMIPVPDQKRVKNRIHWDVVCDDVDALLDRGATVLAVPTESTPWHVLADPQGNEFCAFQPD